MVVGVRQRLLKQDTHIHLQYRVGERTCGTEAQMSSQRTPIRNKRQDRSGEIEPAGFLGRLEQQLWNILMLAAGIPGWAYTKFQNSKTPT